MIPAATNPLASSGSLADLALLQNPPVGVAQTRQFEQTLANVIGDLMSQSSSSSSSSEEDAPVVPTGSSLMPLQLAMALGQINGAKK